MEFYEFIFNEDKIRLDKYLALNLPQFTRTQLQIFINSGYVTVNEVNKKANYILKANDIIKLNVPKATPSIIKAQNIALDIIYEDSDIIIINKAQGMVVHPAVGNKENTLVNALMHHCQDLSGINGELRPGIVHRLDKDTSGLIVACKNDFSHKELSKQFSKRTVKREYIAIVHGVIPHNLGKIEAPIGRDPHKRQQMTVIEGGKEAITNFYVLERFNNKSLVKLTLQTGRTHQIRVHMKYIGFPIYGDPIYAPKNTGERLFLHAKSLGFIHPRTNEYMEFDSPIPNYFLEKIKEL